MSRELYCGVDLHSNNGVYHIMDSEFSTVLHRRLMNSPGEVLRVLEPFRSELVTVAIESTYNWYWLCDVLQHNGYDVVLANPAAMDQYRGMKNVDDHSDAVFIAHLLALDILPVGWICPREVRCLRDLLRRRMLMVNSRTRLVLSLQSMLMRETGATVKLKQISEMPPERLEQLLRSENLLTVAEGQLKLISHHTELITAFEKDALAQCRKRPEYDLLTGIPGVGMILAMTIMLEIGDIRRFRRPGDLSSYARTVQARRTSNGKNKGKNNRHNGNRYLCWAFMEATNHLIRLSPQARRWYEKKQSRTLPVVARCALAAKLSKAVWYMLTENTAFNSRKVFG